MIFGGIMKNILPEEWNLSANLLRKVMVSYPFSRTYMETYGI